MRLARGGRARACVWACLCSQPPPRTPRAGRAEWACGEESLRGVAGVPAAMESAGWVHGDMRTCRLPSAALGVAPRFHRCRLQHLVCAYVLGNDTHRCETPCVVLDAELETWNKETHERLLTVSVNFILFIFCD